MYYKNPKDATKEYGVLQKQNLQNYVKIQESQYQEYTRLYGVNIDYFARNINYYDSEGNIIGSCIDNQNNLDANGTWKFKAMCLESVDQIARYELKEITGY